MVMAFSLLTAISCNSRKDAALRSITNNIGTEFIQTEQSDILCDTTVTEDGIHFTAYDSLNRVIMNVDANNISLERNSYLISYNTETKCPDYVSWRIDRNRLEKNVERSDFFEADADIPEKHRIKHSDYSRSGYDRGHMCPAADNRYDSLAMAECFRMTNMCPQTHRLNAGDWNDLEDLCRKWAEKYNAVYPAKNNKIGARKKYKVIVPERFFKVVLINDGNKLMGIGFILNNNDDFMPLEDYAISIDTVEEITGFDFFSALPDDVENTIESNNKFIDN